MKRRFANYILIFTLVVFFINSFSLASDFRVKSLGQMKLVVEDKNNQLNLYDFGANPAWLLMDKERSWLRSFFISNMQSGNFKRLYDPETLIDLNAQIEGVKILDEKQTFYGSVNYHGLSLSKIYQAINRNPYLKNPFRLIDNTTGSINYRGPRVSFQYSRDLYHKKLFWGAALDYQIETGLKNHFPQPRTIYRYIQLRSGLAYSLSDQLNMGVTFNYSHTQEFTEIISPGTFESRVVVVNKFRGETISTESKGSLENFAKTATYKLGMQSNFKPTDYLETAFLFYYNLKNMNVLEKRFKPKRDGYWKLNGYELHWQTRLKLPNLPLRLGLALDHLYFNDWANHPEFAVLLGDDYMSEKKIGFGIAYEPLNLPLILGAEYHLGLANKKKKDYISGFMAAGDLDSRSLKFGVEYRFMVNWRFRAGFIYTQFKIDHDLLSFSEFLPGNRTQMFTFGMANISGLIESEIYGYIGQQIPIVNKNDIKRKQLGIAFSVKFYNN